MFNARRLQRVSSGLVLLLTCGVSHAAQLIFSDDFEDGNLSGWSASPANTITQEQVFRGTRALKYDSGANTNGNMRVTFAGQQQIYAKFQWFLTSDVTCGSGAHYLRITHNFQTRQLDTQCAGTNGVEFVGFYGGSVGSNGIVGTANGLRIGQWNLFEVYFKLNDVSGSNGELRVWINGNLALERTGLRWRTTSDPISEFHLNTNHNPSREIWYFDDVEVWNDLPSRVTPSPPAQLGVR
jgi:hypothetical protein